MSDSAGSGRKRKIATITAVAAVALGVTACAGTPTGTGSSGQASLSAQHQRAAAVMPSAEAVVTPVTASMPPAMASRTPRQGATPGPGSRPAKSPESSTGYAPSSPAAGRAPSASSVPSTGAAASTGAVPSTAAAASTGAAPSAPATSGASNQTLSVSRGCAAQLTVQTLQQFSCPFTLSGGTPDILYAVDLYVNGNLSLEAGTTPEGLDFTDTDDDTVFTIDGAPEQWGTFAFTVTFYAGSTSASANFTLIVPEPPASQRLPGT
jgi:hypothetical protein